MQRTNRRFLVPVLTLSALLAPGVLGAQTDAPLRDRATGEQEAEGQTLSAMLDLVAEQRELIEEQRKTIRSLEQRLDEVESLALSSHNRLQAMGERAPDLQASTAVEERLAEIESSLLELPENTNVVAAGEFPGSIRIPGTDAALKIGGQVRLTAIQTLDALGSEDRFVTSSIPIAGTEAAGKGSRVAYISTPSRLNFDLRTPTGVGSMRAFVEADFAGPSNAFRLRHAFGQWQKFLMGQTWSTFADPEADPDGIDFEGLNAIALFRQPQIRWTTPAGEKSTLALSVESPRPDVTGAAGLNQFPDVVARFRWEPERVRGPLLVRQGIGHVQAAVVVRQIRAEPEQLPNTTVSTVGFGVNVSGRMSTGLWNDKDNVRWAAYAGKGIGRYITDLRSLGGQDGVYDPETNSVTALPVAAAYVGYQHWWSQTLRSTATFGWVYVDNLDIQEGTALHQTVRYSANVVWSPIPRLDLVTEFLSGQRFNKDGKKGSASQFQLGTRFRF